MNRLVIFFIILFASNNFAFTQAIVNAERFNTEKDSLVIAFSLQYSGTRGNVSTDRADIEPSFIYTGKKNDYKFLSSYGILFQGVNKILNNGFLHARHNYKFSNSLNSFVFGQAQFNDVLLLKKRLATGGGIRINAIKKDSLKLAFSLGLMYEDELIGSSNLPITEVLSTQFIRLTSMMSFKWILNKVVQIDNVVYVQPRITDLPDFRILNDISISFLLSKHLEFTVVSSYRFDSKPPSILKKYDANLSCGLVFSL